MIAKLLYVADGDFYMSGINHLATGKINRRNIFMNILVLDDSDLMRGIIIKTLLEIGLEEDQIHQAENGVQALRMLNSVTFDVLLLDVVMDGVDGIAVLKEAKIHQPTAKVIMCSTFSKSETLKELIKIGIDDFVVKPFDSKRLKESVLKYMPIEPR